MILPSPTASFDWVETAHGPRLVCRRLEPFAAHLFTTRHWRLGMRTPEAEAAWDDVAAALDVDARRLVRGRQGHGTGVAIAREDLPSSQEADIVVSNDSAIAPAIRVADCVPLPMVDRETGAVSA